MPKRHPSERPPRGGKRARTRARLLAAAAEVIAEHGYHRTSLDDIARRAGMTRGAVYGNFKDKDDLMFQVLLAQSAAAPAPPLRPGAPLAVNMRIIGEAVAGLVRERRVPPLGVVSFQLYALTHEPMRRRLLAENRTLYRRLAEGLTRLVPADQLPMPAERFVRVTHALRDGLIVLAGLMPELITDEVIVSAFEALA